jgi:hypothetical protein
LRFSGLKDAGRSVILGVLTEGGRMDSESRQRTKYSTPELRLLGTVEELTCQIGEKCTGSADAVLPRELPRPDFDCVIDSSTGPG